MQDLKITKDMKTMIPAIFDLEKDCKCPICGKKLCLEDIVNHAYIYSCIDCKIVINMILYKNSFDSQLEERRKNKFWIVS